MKDFVLPNRKDRATKKSDTTMTRLLLIIIAFIAFFVALAKPVGIIKIVEWAFGGFASMFLPIIAALYWKRCSKGATFASIIVSQGINICFPLFLVPAASKIGGSMAIMFGNTGYLPAFWSVVGGAVVLFLGVIFFPERDKAWTEDYFSTFKK